MENNDKHTDCCVSGKYVKRICLITPSIYFDGGVSLAGRELAKILAGRGMEVHIISNKKEKSFNFDTPDNVKIHNLKSSLKIYPFGEIEFAIKAAKKLESINENFDLIHVTGPVILTKLFSKKYNSAVWVTTVQGTNKSLMRWMLRFPLKGAAKPIYLFSQLVTYYYEKLIYYLLQPYTIAVSKTTKEELIGFGLIKEKIFVIPNGVDLRWPEKALKENSENRLSNAVGPGRDIVLLIGDITPRKGLHLLMEAIPRILSVKQNVVFVFVGQVNLPGYFSYLVSKAEKNKNNIFFTGFLPHSLLSLYYSKCSLFVLPSYSEGAPLVIPEAMAFKKPVIATAACAYDEYLEKECVVQTDNSKELAERIITFLTDGKFSQGIADRLWLKVKDLSWEKIAEETFRLYTKLKLIAVVSSYTMLSFQRLSKLYDIVLDLEKKGVNGSFVECGVCNGGSAGIIAAAAGHNRGRNIWLFDSWQGMPAPDDFDFISYSGSYGKEGSMLGLEERVRELLFNSLAIDTKSIHIVKGWFNKTLPVCKNNIGDIALLHLDCDWYKSTKCCFDELYDNIIDGGFVVIDDYGHWEGCKKAVNEFMKKRGINKKLIPVDYTGVYFQK